MFTINNQYIQNTNKKVKITHGIVGGYSGPSSLLPSQKQSNGVIILHGIMFSKIFSIKFSSKSGVVGTLQMSRNPHVMSNICTVTAVACLRTSKCVSIESAVSTDPSGSRGVWISSWCVVDSFSPRLFCVYMSSCSRRPPSVWSASENREGKRKESCTLVKGCCK